MFNVRPDQLWPWIRFEPPSEDPPGFRMAADGSIRAADESGSEFPATVPVPVPLRLSTANSVTHIAPSAMASPGKGVALV